MSYSACSFTGHRKICKEHRSELASLLDRAILYLYENGCRDFYAGGALGFDTVAAKQVIAFRMLHRDVKLHLVIPCQDQSKSWSASDVRMYEYVLASADTVEFISDEYFRGCMLRRNDRLISLSDVTVAYYDGSERGGTAYTVKCAKKKGSVIFNLYPELEKTTK